MTQDTDEARIVVDSANSARIAAYCKRLYAAAHYSGSDDAEDMPSILADFQSEIEAQVKEDLAEQASRSRVEASLSESQELPLEEYSKQLAQLAAVYNSMTDDLVKVYYYQLLSDYAAVRGLDLANYITA